MSHPITKISILCPGFVVTDTRGDDWGEPDPALAGRAAVTIARAAPYPGDERPRYWAELTGAFGPEALRAVNAALVELGLHDPTRVGLGLQMFGRDTPTLALHDRLARRLDQASMHLILRLRSNPMVTRIEAAGQAPEGQPRSSHEQPANTATPAPATPIAAARDAA